ncbi:MAG TPA: hypothetical protein PKV59_08055, partial [Flexilinea sp.]|nr:hypothetical protein [Flexilinea sp.]
RHDGANPTRAGSPLALDSAIPSRLLSLRFSHRFQRIAKAQLIWCPTSSDVSGIFLGIRLLMKH